MPLFGGTPESLLNRNDSKNPATTCRGITSAGRPCRRALAAKNQTLIASDGFISIDGKDSSNVAFYCWQHKEQAIHRAVESIPQTHEQCRSGTRQQTAAKLYPVRERTSLETLVQRLNINAPPSIVGPAPSGPDITPSVKDSIESRRPTARLISRHHVKPRPKPPGFWASLCCTSPVDDGDYLEIVRHRKRVDRPQPLTQPLEAPQAATSRPFNGSSDRPPRRPRNERSSPSDVLSQVPSHVSPQIATTLLNELVKPISSTDEPGYIYIFWLTPQQKTPTPQTAQSLLSPGIADDKPHRRDDRRLSDVMTEFSFRSDDDEDSQVHHRQSRSASQSSRKTILLKIGRANNITRRMHEWERQCGYAVSLVRWYPYISSSTPSSSPRPKSTNTIHDHRLSLSNGDVAPIYNTHDGLVRKVPSVKRVERLIHLELSENQVKRQCLTCGREHREWFQVEATRAGIRAVDDCIKRWVRWAERGQSSIA